MASQSTPSSESIAVIGSGLIGSSWSMMFAKAGFRVRLFDTIETQLSAAVASIRDKLHTLARESLIDEHEIPSIIDRIETFTILDDALNSVVYVQECIPEVVAMKTELFVRVDRLATPSVVIGSSSSNLVPSSFTADLPHRNRYLVCHPINPPFSIPLVEIVPAPWTDAAAVEFTRSLMQRIGQAPIVLKKEIDGFCINRLQFALLAEAYRLVEDGVLSAHDVDLAVSHGLGRRWAFMGPFQTIDLNAPGGVADYHKRYTEGVLRVVQTMDNTRPWKQETINHIEQELSQEVSRESLSKRVAWRDQQLLALAKHLNAQEPYHDPAANASSDRSTI